MLGDGTFDATALLVLWCIRKAFFPLLLIGLSAAVVLGQDSASLGESLQRELEGLDTPGDLVSTLLSPFAGVIVAIVLRLAVGRRPLRLRTQSLGGTNHLTTELGDGWTHNGTSRIVRPSLDRHCAGRSFRCRGQSATTCLCGGWLGFRVTGVGAGLG